MFDQIKMEFQQIWVAILRYVQKQGFAVFLLCCCLVFLWRQSENYQREARRLQDEQTARYLQLAQELKQRIVQLESDIRDCNEQRQGIEIELAKTQIQLKKLKR